MSSPGHHRRDFRLSPLAGQPECPTTFVTDTPRARIHPCDQNRAGTERFMNSAARDSKRFPSCHDLASVWLASRYDSPGCPREVNRTAHPFARALHRDAPSRVASVPLELDRAALVSFNDECPRPKIRLADLCNPTCQKRAPDVSRDYGVAAGVSPDALSWTIRFTPTGPLWPAPFSPVRSEHFPLAPSRVRLHR